MAGIRESTAQEKYEYQTEPAIIAQVCQDILKQIGSVTEVSRETGTIAGKITMRAGFNNAKILIRLSRKDEITEMSVQTRRGEGLFTGSGAQTALTMFMQAMGEDKRLSGKSTGGW